MSEYKLSINSIMDFSVAVHHTLILYFFNINNESVVKKGKTPTKV